MRDADQKYPNLVKDPIGKEFLRICGEINTRHYNQRFWNPKLDSKLQAVELNAYVKKYTKKHQAFFSGISTQELEKAKQLNNFILDSTASYKLI